MYRPMLICAFLLPGMVVVAQQPAAQQPATQQPATQQPATQQQGAQSDQYQGQSNPPADDVILTAPQDPPQPTAKPQAGKLLAKPVAPTDEAAGQSQAPAGAIATRGQGGASAAMAAHPSSVDPSVNFPDADVTGTDDGIVGVAKEPQDPALHARAESSDSGSDPDGDIVHPHPLAPGELENGTTIRVHLLTRLSTVDTQPGEVFRTRVATDVLQDGQVLIPAGAEIDGRVVQVSSGTMRSHGSMLLRPDTVILLDGTRFHMDAQVSGTPGTRDQVSSEGYINPGSRLKKDSVKYGAGVGAGVVTGALVAGPVGAVTGGIIGAGAITVHLLVNHSEATLQPGTVLLFTLDSRLDLRAAGNSTGD